MNDLAAPALDTPSEPAPHAEAQPVCQNCGHRGAGRYCQECGQSFDTHRITLPHLLHEVFHLFTHVEKGLLYTLRELAVHPGQMQRRYLAGQRTQFQKPFSSFFLACTITALGQYAIKALVAHWYGMQDASEDYFRHYFALMQVVLLPLYALITWLFFRNTKYNYAEIAVVVLYNLSLVLYGVLFINLWRLLWPGFDSKYVEVPLLLVYNVWTYFQLFPTTSRRVLVAKALFINLSCYALSHVAGELFVYLRH